MTRKECLDMAAQCVLQDRACQYGGMEDNFRVIANFWSVYLGRKVYPADVAMMMSLLKIARIRGNKAHADSFVDLAGYAACGAECAGGKPAPKADEESKFRHGDAAEWYSLGARGMEPGWHSAVYLRNAEAPDYCVVREPDGRERIVDRRYLRRPEAKAEGCEELVQKDAPQTPQELYQHIVDCNPSVYPRKPTGEELAEMAQEDAHG